MASLAAPWQVAVRVQAEELAGPPAARLVWAAQGPQAELWPALAAELAQAQALELQAAEPALLEGPPALAQVLVVAVRAEAEQVAAAVRLLGAGRAEGEEALLALQQEARVVEAAAVAAVRQLG